MYKRWTPGSRRDRRRARSSSRRSGSAGTDKGFLLVAGLFMLGVAAVFVLFLWLVYSAG
ncbi:MAG: hypothetical protein M3R38_06455 [Actinomycetota bacterium]|nr:hypothetical protein [Actinomycetota bacterium]MDP9475323.1 hypothetical protein [Actinomycetota bacterium]